MDIQVELDAKSIKESLLLGRLLDLEILTEHLNGAWPEMDYRLEPIKGKKAKLYFVEDADEEEEAIQGLILLKGEMAYASSSVVHRLVMDAYHRYVRDFGEIPTE